MVGAIERELKIKASFNAQQAIQQARQLKNEFAGLGQVQTGQIPTPQAPTRSPLPAPAPTPQPLPRSAPQSLPTPTPSSGIGRGGEDIAALSQSLRLSFTEAQKLTQQLGLTGAEARKAADLLLTLKQAGATVEQQFNSLNQDLGISKQQFDQLNASTTGIKDGLTQVGVAAGALAGTIGLVFASGLQSFTEFDRAIRQAGVVSGSSAEDIQYLREETERLGIVTSKTPAEIARTSVEFARAGFTAVETADALEGIARASEATGEQISIVGDIIGKTSRTFAIPAEESGRVADILVQTANATNTSINGLGESFSYVGAVAAAANQPLEDVAVLLGLLGDKGIQGSQAGTNLAAGLERLKIASAASETEFANLVRGSARSAEAFKVIGTEVRNADGSMKSVLEILPILQKNLDGLDQRDRDAVFKALFGIEGGRAFETLISTAPERIESVTEAIRNSQGVAVESGEALLQGLGGALDLLEGSVGAASAKVGEFLAIGVEPLVRGATFLLNTFLGFPPVFQAAIVGVTGFAGALAGAVALLATFEALQIRQNAAAAFNTGTILANTIARQVNTAVTTASAIASGILNTQLTGQNVALVANTIATQAAALAQKVFAASTGATATAAVALTGKLLLLAAQAALVVGAIAAVAQVFKRSEGAEFAQGLDQAVDKLQEVRGESEKVAETGGGIQDLAQSYEDFFTTLQQEGIVQALGEAFVDLQSVILGTVDSTDEFGASFGFITREQRGNQIAAIALADNLTELGSTVDDTAALFTKYGQTVKGSVRELTGDELAQFTEEAEKQSAALEEEIKLLEESKDGNEERDAELEGEIELRRRLIKTIQDRVAAQGGQIEANQSEEQSTESLGDKLGALGKEYDRLAAQSQLQNTQAQSNITQQLAQGLITESDAQLQRAQLEAQALRDTIEKNEILIGRLNALRSQATTPEETAQIDDQILNAQSEIAQAQNDLAQNQIDEQQRVADEQERIREEAIEAERERVERIQDAQQDAVDTASEAETARLIEVQRLLNAGVISQEEADSRRLQSANHRIQSEIAAEQEALAALEALPTPDDPDVAEERQQSIRAARQRTSDLTLQLLENEQRAQEAVRQAAIEALEEQVLLQQNVAEAAAQGYQQQQVAIDAITSSLDRQSQLLQARSGLQSAINGAIQSEFDAAASLTNDEERRAQIQERAARARLTGLQQAQAIERQLFEIQLLQNQAALERERIENRIAQARNAAETAQAQADLEALRADPRATEGQIQAAQLQVQARQQEGQAIQVQAAGIEEGAAIQQQIAALERATLAVTQQSALTQAQGEVRAAEIAQLPEERREAAEERESRAALRRANELETQFEGLGQSFSQGLSLPQQSDFAQPQPVVIQPPENQQTIIPQPVVIQPSEAQQKPQPVIVQQPPVRSGEVTRVPLEFNEPTRQFSPTTLLNPENAGLVQSIEGQQQSIGELVNRLNNPVEAPTQKPVVNVQPTPVTQPLLPTPQLPAPNIQIPQPTVEVQGQTQPQSAIQVIGLSELGQTLKGAIDGAAQTIVAGFRIPQPSSLTPQPSTQQASTPQLPALPTPQPIAISPSPPSPINIQPIAPLTAQPIPAVQGGGTGGNAEALIQRLSEQIMQLRSTVNLQQTNTVNNQLTGAQVQNGDLEDLVNDQIFAALDAAASAIEASGRF